MVIAAQRLVDLLEAVCKSEVCKGNFEEKYTSLPNIHDDVLMNQSSKFIFSFGATNYDVNTTGTEVVGILDSSRTGVPSIHHAKCEILVNCAQERCGYCGKHRKSLTAMASRASRSDVPIDDRTSPTSHTTYLCLTSKEKSERLHRLHSDKRACQQQVRRLQEAIDESILIDGVTVDKELNGDLLQLMKNCTENVYSSPKEGTFERLFWDQQQKANSLENSKSMRWHPLVIKWCLYLRHLSGNAYELLRSSGCIKLPSQRTLRDYTHYIKSQVGFSAEVDQAIVDAADLTKDLHKYVTLIMDEMYIKSDLVYDKHDGTLIGFVNIGDVNNQLLDFQAFIDNGESKSSLATTMMVFMVKGLLHKFEYPYAQFACGSMSGDLIFDPIWEAIARLERIGFFVLALCCDGASSNRKLWKLHSKGKELVYRVPNVFAAEGKRFLYFISDPPHLIKTIRNSWYNKKRKLWVINISFSKYHLIFVYVIPSAMGKTLSGSTWWIYIMWRQRRKKGHVL